jgi:4-hydroxysphinganine ceramide fatty acyl 2-hydroxylase
MREFKIDNKGSKKLFSNKILERLSRTWFAVPIVFYFCISALVIIYFSGKYEYTFIQYFLLYPSGALIFTLVEYLIHRFIFHFNATTERELKIQYNIHGVHHEFPRDKSRLVMPPVISILLSAMFFFLFSFVFGSEGYILFSGFIAGYSTYLIIHYAVHAWKPPSNVLRYLWRHHSLHHYSSVESAFSVSFPLWDKLFGTMPADNKKFSSRLPDNEIS